MESRFAHLYKRDSSVSMIRVKMSRRRSQTQKENRQRMQNLRRHLDQLAEVELSMNVSTNEKSIIHNEKPGSKGKVDKSKTAAEERKKMLERFKENKALQKEKEKREKEKKGLFKVSLYRPQPLGYLPSNPVVQSTAKTKDSVAVSTRVTRSMKQYQQPKVPTEKQPALKKPEPAPSTRNNRSAPVPSRGRTTAADSNIKAPTTRAAAKSATANAPIKSVPQQTTETKTLRTRSANKQSAVPSSTKGKIKQENNTEHEPADIQMPPTVKSSPPKEQKMPEETNVTPPSFAPQGFVFQAPTGLRSFQPAPLSPHSADAFLSPSISFEPSTETPVPELQPPDTSVPDSPTPPASQPALSLESASPPPATLSCVSPPPATLSCVSPPPVSALSPPVSALSPPVSAPSPPVSAPSPPVSAPPPPVASQSSTPPPPASLEPQHDVPYFRAIMASETERLMGLSKLWESRFDDSSIPEEIRDRMRTAVGQARLLMKERFGQFSGLVDDCDLGRGEKITTCTDLQGFWDMVYFQVEDVNKKFHALKEAEARGWQEEIVCVTRQKKVIKKLPPSGARPGVGASAAAKSRLAAVKAAMKAKKAAAEKTAGASDATQNDISSDAPENPVAAQTVVFQGGFFQVESPIKVVGAMRRSSRQSTAVSSPRKSLFSTPSRQQRTIAVVLPSLQTCCASPAGVTSVCTPKRSVEQPQLSPKLDTSYPRDPHATHHTSITPEQEDLRHVTVVNPVNPTTESESRLSQSGEPELLDSMAAPEESVPAAASSQQAQDVIFPHEGQIRLGSPEASGFSVAPPAISLSPEAMDTGASVPSSPSVMSTTPQQVHAVHPFTSDSADSYLSGSVDAAVTEARDMESAAGLDIERYMRSTERCSFSLEQSTAGERFSLGHTDTEMESPVAQAQEPSQDSQMTPTALPRLTPLVFPVWPEELPNSQLLFTPKQRESVRQSVCERDLMMFTPPSYK